MSRLERAVRLGVAAAVVPPDLARAVVDALASGEQDDDLGALADVLCVDGEVLGALLLLADARPAGDREALVEAAREVRADATGDLPTEGVTPDTGFWNSVERRLARRGVQVIGSQLPSMGDADTLQNARGPQHDAPAPTAIGHYQDPVEINRGGMGAILRATDPNARREVAIKVMHAQRGTGAELMQAFLDEAQLNAQLEHPNIVPVHEVGLTPEGRLYFTMKLVRGESLAERVRQAHARPLTATLREFLKICEAVGFAHARGVIHRDLKPANIMVGEFGEVLVMDWGLAVPASRVAEWEGAIVGTPGFMAPEQARGEVVDQRCDLYGLGAILYALLCGRYPFRGKTAMAVMQEVLDGAMLPPSAHAPVPRELEAVVLRAMAHDREQRYDAVQAMADDIEAFLEGRTLAAADYTPLQRLAKWASRHRALVAGAAAVLAVALGVYTWQRVAQQRAATDAARAELRRAHGLLSASSGDAFAARLEAVAAADRALRTLHDDDDARGVRRRAGLELGRLALARQDYTLARHAFAALRRHGATDDAVAKLLRGVEQARGAEAERLVTRLRWMLDQLGRPIDERDAAADLGDLIIEAGGFRRPETTAVLIDALGRLRAPWSDAGRDVATLCCRVLARSGDPRAVEALAAFARRVGERALMIEAGLALCRTRDAAAYDPLLELRERLGTRSRDWVRIGRQFALVPRPTVERPTARHHLHLGLLAKQSGDNEAARRHYEAALEADPKLQRAWHNLAMVDLREGLLGRAIERFDRALAIEESASSLVMRSYAYTFAHRNEEAVAGCERALALEPELAIAYWIRGIARRRLGQEDAALKDLDRAIMLEPEDARFFASRSLSRFLRGDPDGALRDAQRAVGLDPKNWRAHDALGLARRGRKELDQAIGAHDEAIRLAPRASEPYFHRAQVRLRQSRLEDAIADYTRALERQPDHRHALRERGWLYLRRSELDRALKDIDALLGLDPRDARGWNLRGNIHYSKKAYDTALDDYRKAIAADPTLASPYFSVGHIHRLRGQHDQAIPMFRTFLKLNPKTIERQRVEAYLRERGAE